MKLIAGLMAAASAVPGTPVYTQGQDGYDTIRIPSIVRTVDGTLLAFAEGRVNGQGDDGNIDIVLRRSSDGGRTWGPLQKVWDVGTDRAGNPTPVVDRRTGIVHLIVIRTGGSATEDSIRLGQVAPEDARRVFHLASRDDGASWSQPREITRAVKPAGFRHYATRPGHGIQLRRGRHRGRLVIAANHSVAPAPGSGETGLEDEYYACHVIYSDDGWRWKLGAVDADYGDGVNCNEQSAVELADGRIAFNARDQNGPAPGNRALTAWSSADETRTWDAGNPVYDGPSAYSDLVGLDPRTSGLLFEAGVTGPYQEISFVRLRP